MAGKSFKEKWLEKDILCSYCGNVTKQAKGLTRQNIKKLFKLPSFNDFLMLFIITMVVVTSWAYNRDVSVCREYIKDQQHRTFDANVINNNYGENYSSVEKFEEGNQTINITV